MYCLVSGLDSKNFSKEQEDKIVANVETTYSENIKTISNLTGNIKELHNLTFELAEKLNNLFEAHKKKLTETF